MEPCKGEVEGPIGLLLPDRPPNKIFEPQKETSGGSKESDRKKEGEVEKGRRGGERKEGRKEGRGLWS